jgi:erythromycin esterase-like protein
MCAAHAAGLDCQSEPQLQVERITARVVLVGETHGTEQAPAFVGRLLCSLQRSGRPVVLALERDTGEQASFDRFLSSAGQRDDVGALLAQGEWAAPIQDGRSSAAMLALLDRLRQWRSAGVTVPVVALRSALRFDGQPPEPRQLQILVDRAMADGVSAALGAHPGHTVVVLAGSFHTAVGSRLHHDAIAGPSMGDVLVERGPVHVIGLSSSSGGTAWFWRGGDAGPGPHEEQSGRFDLPDARVDSTIEIGPLTASLPARRLSN